MLKKICILKTAGIILPKCSEVRNLIKHIQSKEPSICNIYFDFFDGLTHTFNAIKILNERYFYESYWVHTWTTLVWRIFFLHQFIYKRPINCLINNSKQVVLWNHVIHTKQLYLFPFLVSIFCQHKQSLLILILYHEE